VQPRITSQASPDMMMLRRGVVRVALLCAALPLSVSLSGASVRGPADCAKTRRG
jgi:hypothetical protein